MNVTKEISQLLKESRELVTNRNFRTIQVMRFNETSGDDEWIIVRMKELRTGDVFKMWEGQVGGFLLGTFQASGDPQITPLNQLIEVEAPWWVAVKKVTW